MKINNIYCGRYNLFVSVVSLFIPFYCSAQVNFQKFPIDNQILQRDEKDEATIAISGTVDASLRGKVSLKIWQEEKLYAENEITLTGQTQVSFTPKIKAGEYNYYLKVYFNGNEIKKADRVVAGDIYLFYGQSNALGYSGINEYQPLRNVFLRYYVMYNFDNKEGEWLVPFETSQWPGTGLFPLELERMLYEKHKYPIGVIVGAVGGADIATLGNRNAANPADTHTDYGRLLTQVNTSGQKEQLKYLIFRHGESDASFINQSETYPHQFTKLLNHLKTDIPNIKKIYNFQTNILITHNTRAGFLREFQRNSENVSSTITNISTVGTTGYDGLHYNTAGYHQTSFELARILGKEIYGAKESAEIYSPDLKKAYWENNQLVLEFDEGMKMVYPKDTIINNHVWRMKDFIYIDGKSGLVTSGNAVGNKIYLNTTAKGSTVSYLPSSYGNPTPLVYYNGTHFKNSLGMRAFSFDHVSIKNNPIEVSPHLGPLTLYIDPQTKCIGTPAEVHYTTYEFDANQIFKVQLSDANGSFASSRILGEGNKSPIIVNFPEDVKTGDHYKIRLVTDNKTNELATNSFAIQIKPSVSISTKTPQITEGAQGNIHLKFTGLPPFDVLLSDSSLHKSTRNELDLIVKPLETITYKVLGVSNICGMGKTDGTAAIEVKKIILENEPGNLQTIKVFPNPTTDYFTITTDSKLLTDFRLFDAKGGLVKEIQFYEQHKISTKHLHKGVYFYQMKIGKFVNSGKILVQ
ncbi:sialate O-acetylesterase [Emticicia agri]|uniref:T9SS type A sorting domain-containing protein n=1 Tax=Emticicia agri TaxID=2492393 RepID=A0A4Q5LU27_9BACT|nr:sialate O-acetylesterase [Emticicia agri]RYU93084.1 T9SS type A sorting domain-containing protein [Emticicia agri]